ncbi:DUF481 domain-containing protein [Cyanothece sp. BG0011]|uniref:DUF481 domain-containing protein n=1 Tax=Cyanothece sp. BG0011 TaxID=2082950 RepID=UPI000D1EFD27|nr:DUF481 domain-containing protein [Cyanothece sp. BG0011]
MLKLFCYGLLLANLESFITTNQNINQPKIIELNPSHETNDMGEIDRLSQTLEMINKMDDSEVKVMLLNDLAVSYAKFGKLETANNILEQSLLITKDFEDITLRITKITEIAHTYYKIGEKDQGLAILENTLNLVNRIEDKFLQGQLLLNISLKYGEMGQEEKSQMLLGQSEKAIIEASQAIAEFPFKQTGSRLNLGLNGNVASFRNTRAALGFRVNFYQQWPEEDIYIDGNLLINYDSNRTVNNYRPNSLIKSVYRRHFNPQWNVFTAFFNSTNQDLFATRNNNEDLTIISNILVGAGFNLWRGNSIRQFLDLQLGLGTRYEYDYINFEKRRDEIDPTLGILLFGRGFSFKEARLNQNFAIIPSLDNFNNYTITLDTNLSLPISDRWSLNNRLFLRYRNEVSFEENPNLEFLFTTGVNYQF